MKAWYLNLGPSTTTIAEANSDIRAILGTEPALFLGTEALRKGALPTVKGYGKLRMFRPQGRANLFAYIKDGVDDWAWEDCRVKFPREPGTPGMHPARSILRFNYEGIQVIDAHKPPDWPGSGPARVEHDKRLTKIMAPWTDEKDWKQSLNQKERDAAKARPRLLMWDRNMGPFDAKQFADGVDGKVTGEEIDSAVSRNIKITDHEYTRRVDGHLVHTDHPWGAFFLRFEL